MSFRDTRDTRQDPAKIIRHSGAEQLGPGPAGLGGVQLPVPERR